MTALAKEVYIIIIMILIVHFSASEIAYYLNI